MYARVATFEGADRAEMQQNVEGIRERSASGPPEGVPATGFLLLTSLEGAKAVAIGLFETEEDLRQGDEVLNSMDPPVPGGMGRRTSVEMFEVAVQRSA
jgi:hypothetical protein